MSMTLDIDGGMASYVGVTGVGAACTEGRDAAIAAAIEVAMVLCQSASPRSDGGLAGFQSGKREGRDIQTKFSPHQGSVSESQK